jgi:hypothetical protein
MTKQKIIEHTLKEMGASSYEYDETVSALQKKLPDTDIKTCEDFRHLKAECCDTCHRMNPVWEMELKKLPDGGNAWVCCAVSRAIFPKSEQKDDDAIKLHKIIFGEDCPEK